MLAARDLKAGYGHVPVLHDVSFSLTKGETLVLLGRNGVGKTTLLKSLIGITTPTSGEILLNDENVTGWAPHKLAYAGVAYVPQGRGIFGKLTVEENLLVGLRSRNDGRKTIPDEIWDMFPILRERIDQLAGTFSGGQQQILALARALCGAPELMLLDEPSEGIQPSIVQQIGDLLKTFNQDLNLTVLLVEQNLELAKRSATRCLVMEKGRISGQLSKEDLQDEDKVFKALAL
ncbi:ABC transporter ATP-binding protein [Hoeflea prorocentri]|uniref:ABC transporter ATP-binding protein n=1 Tax=Hoeflea prorocentri TaxID=1922333 RepID=A0A9X3UEF2_9HYPH|nr:ABC transporter ATP-binding protein [Hoeflea prorocentri]MCY6379357.1 ABC transporter ATP-binding protein [Hoeflea prorocentri]MDA5397158.1 ABC transporter ATP-binding protein [Hoeflea prorocentri]